MVNKGSILCSQIATAIRYGSLLKEDQRWGGAWEKRRRSVGRKRVCGKRDEIFAWLARGISTRPILQIGKQSPSEPSTVLGIYIRYGEETGKGNLMQSQVMDNILPRSIGKPWDGRNEEQGSLSGFVCPNHAPMRNRRRRDDAQGYKHSMNCPRFLACTNSHSYTGYWVRRRSTQKHAA